MAEFLHQLRLVVYTIIYTYLLGKLGGGNSNIFVMFTPILGEMIQFDEHIFQMGWNHQPEMVRYHLDLPATQ